jgi:hypothetical protein
MSGRKSGWFGAMLAVGALAVTAPVYADPVYVAGTAPSCGTCVFGTHLGVGPAGSVAGVGGSGIDAVNGTALNGVRTYIWDQGGFVNDGSVTRGDADFAMMVWDLGLNNALDTVRLYTHQDHYSGGLVADNFVAQDLMEYSVWGSNDNTTFTMLSDVIGFNLNGGLPTYTFAGTAPSVVYRGGSAEHGILNAYTRDYTFANAYRYYGIRASSVTLDYCDGTASTPGVPNTSCIDADPELDALAFNKGPINVPEPASMALVGMGLAWVAARRLRRR